MIEINDSKFVIETEKFIKALTINEIVFLRQMAVIQK